MGKMFENEMLIRNVDCGVLYFQIKDDNAIEEYEHLKKEKVAIEESNERDENRLLEVQERIEELSKKIHTFKDKEVKFSDKSKRYNYSGTIADSLMGRKLRQVAKDRKDRGEDNAIRTIGDCDYTDIIINLKFKSDIMIPDNTPKKVYDEKKDCIVEVDEKKMKRLISKKKLRQIAYRDGVIINGIHYVNYQRTSSKARTGNDLFIDERYFNEMDDWQNMGIPFRKMVKSEDEKNHNPYEEADIVAIRSYQSLIASSIIGELEIDPYSILLIDDVSGCATMDCNVVKLDDEGKGLRVVREPYMQCTDLWDGQSLLDRSVFEKSKYASRNKSGNIEEHSYKDYGFILLRNHFFKTAVFNTNLQDYYNERYKGIENPIINDSFGNEFSPDEILMVTTRNSVKIFKFADIICTYMIEDNKKTKLVELEIPLIKAREEQKRNKQAVTIAKRNLSKLLNFKPDKDKNKQPPTENEILEATVTLEQAEKYYDSNYERLEKKIKELSKPVKFEQERLTWDWYREKIKDQKFGCCKTEHKSKFGDKQQLWYQVIGSLNFDKDKLWQLVEPQVTEINLMKKHVAWFKRGIDMRATENVGDSMMLALLNINDDITRTKWYTNYRGTRLHDMKKRLLAGKVQIKGSDFCTLVGNPYEMLRASCGDKIESSIINNFECYCPRYKDGEELYGMRSPHICTGNNALLKNTYCDEWKWFNFTDNIIAINFWEKGAFLSPRWNGCDTDSDSAYIGNNPIILKEVKKVQNRDYLIPINAVPQMAKKYQYTDEEMAKVDGQLCNDLIGKICNLARDLQSMYWHLYNTGTEDNKKKYLSMMYDDICLLEVLSNIAIDSAKRRYECNMASEIKKIKTRPYMTAQGAIIKDDSIVFTETRYKKSLSDNTIKAYEEYVRRRDEETNTEMIEEINAEIDKLLKTTDTYMIRPDFAKDLKTTPKHKAKYKKNETEDEKVLNRKKRIAYAQEQKALKEKIYRKLKSPMDILKSLIKEKSVRCDRTNYLSSFVEILKPIPKGTKADYNRIEAIKKVCYDAKKQIDFIQCEYKANRRTFDEMYEEKENIKRDVINNIRGREVTEWDIHKLIRDVYDIRPKKDKHGKIMIDKNGKPEMIDKTDKELIKAELGGLLLQWIYAAHTDKFLNTIRESGHGTISYVKKYEPTQEANIRVNSLKDLGKLINEREIYELDGEKYIIEQCHPKRKKKTA